MDYRIIEDTCIHNNKELPCYVPQYKVNIPSGVVWYKILSNGSYILKQSQNNQ